ncbi:MAG: histidine kinase, partial [Jatrophihabitantaceae bacterium]
MQPEQSTPDRRRVRTAAVGAALAAALAGSIVAAGIDAGQHAYRTDEVLAAFANCVAALVGAVVTLSVPGNLIGWLLVGGTAVAGVGEAMTEAGVHGVLTAPGSVPGAAYLVTFGVTLRSLAPVIFTAAVPAYFPDGCLPGPRWVWLRRVVIAAVCFTIAGGIVAPVETRLGDQWRGPLSPHGSISQSLQLLELLGAVFTLGAIVGASAGLVSRWRRRGPVVRQQLLLFSCGVVLAAVFLIAVIIVAVSSPNGSLPRWTFAVAGLPLPIAIAIATLNHGLYDLRRAANRTILWMLMSAILVGIYAAVVLTAVALVPDRGAWWASAGAAIVTALVLVPLRERLQRLVGRVVYGRWREPYEVLSALAERLGAAADVDRLLDAAVAQLGSELDLQDIGVRDLDGATVTGAAGSDGATSVPLQAYGTTVGWLDFRRPDRELSASERRLVRDLASHLGGTLHARALLRDLQHTRERLVLAREEERRRLRRDLHDGLGPALAGLTLKAETAQAMLPPDAADAARQLQDLSEEIRMTVGDVRRVVEGLRPPALDELGLLGACTEIVKRLTAAGGVLAGVQVDDRLPPLPAAVEVAAFRIVQEAVTNIVRHAHARNCCLSLASTARELVVTVKDDGIGLGEHARRGNGLATMRERAEELGGTFTVVDAQPGVCVEARLPSRAGIA